MAPFPPTSYWCDGSHRLQVTTDFFLFQFSETVFMAIYFAEFFLKIFVAPLKYWKNLYNMLDFCVLFIACIPCCLTKLKHGYLYASIASGVQSLRILKLISYCRGMMP
ncbi:cation channel sperm-associated protein 3-like [Ornithorhynchus anatinus]|uniref:cation channel sperm-associated protein 3-like n=1 Tax=Ornithorhynchus anatinus TaxID=9258 RepID=UPI0019D44BEC|nr:cation channel sperm-associated protein 3-like [Ornithorhynchus anatinus]